MHSRNQGVPGPGTARCYGKQVQPVYPFRDGRGYKQNAYTHSVCKYPFYQRQGPHPLAPSPCAPTAHWLRSVTASKLPRHRGPPLKPHTPTKRLESGVHQGTLSSIALATVWAPKGLVIGNSTREGKVTSQTPTCLVSCPTFSPIYTLGAKKELPFADSPNGPDTDLEIQLYKVGVRIPVHIDE